MSLSTWQASQLTIHFDPTLSAQSLLDLSLTSSSGSATSQLATLFAPNPEIRVKNDCLSVQGFAEEVQKRKALAQSVDVSLSNVTEDNRSSEDTKGKV